MYEELQTVWFHLRRGDMHYYRQELVKELRNRGLLCKEAIEIKNILCEENMLLVTDVQEDIPLALEKNCPFLFVAYEDNEHN